MVTSRGDIPPAGGDDDAGDELDSRSLTARAVRDPVTVGLVGAMALFTVFLWARPVDVGTGVVAFWAATSVLDLMLFASARRVSRLPALPAQTRRFWRLLSVGGLLFAAGDTAQVFAAVRRPGRQAAEGGNVQTVFFVVATAWIVYVLLGYPVKARASRERLRFWLDVSTALVAAAVFAWTVTITPAFLDRGLDQLFGVLVATALLIAAAFAAAKLIVDGDAPVTRAAAGPAIAGIVLQACLTPLIAADLDQRWFPLLLAARLLPSVLIVLGPRLQELQLRGGAQPVGHRPRRRFSTLPYFMIAGTYLMLVVVLLPDLTSRVAGVLVGVILTSVLVVARQLVAFTDNANLLEQLDASLHELARNEQRFRNLVLYSSDITTMLSSDGIMTYVSPSVERILGHHPSALEGRSLAEILHPDDLTGRWDDWRHLRATQNVMVSHQARYRHADGSWRWLEVISRNLTHDPSVGCIVSNSREVTQTRQLHDKLRRQAFHDGLTGLANRMLFKQELASVTARGRPAAIIMIDLDGFKEINDTRGHHVGDCVLLAVASRLKGCIRHADTAARIGGDELAVLLPDADADTAADIAARFLGTLAEPVRIDGEVVDVQASIGIAAGHPKDSEQLLRQADAAMYTAKRQGKGRYVRAVPAPSPSQDSPDAATSN